MSSAWGQSFGTAWGESWSTDSPAPVVAVVPDVGGGDDDAAQQIQRGGRNKTYREPPKKFVRELPESIRARMPRRISEIEAESVIQAISEVAAGRTVVRRRSDDLRVAVTQVEEDEIVAILMAADIL